jgi:hypothetical protein
MKKNKNMALAYAKITQKLRQAQVKRSPIPVKDFNKVKPNQKRK